jgi:hypothetical protein
VIAPHVEALQQLLPSDLPGEPEDDLVRREPELMALMHLADSPGFVAQARYELAVVRRQVEAGSTNAATPTLIDFTPGVHDPREQRATLFDARAQILARDPTSNRSVGNFYAYTRVIPHPPCRDHRALLVEHVGCDPRAENIGIDWQDL